MKKFIFLSMLVLCGCATPETILKSPQGNYFTCGGGTAGSIAGGMIGYSIQRDNDEKCVEEHKAQGYTVVDKILNP